MAEPDIWYDEFWDALGDSEDDGTIAVRLLGELLASEGIWRDGDYLKGRQGQPTALSPDDQHLVRRIEHAIERAREATADEELSEQDSRRSGRAPSSAVGADGTPTGELRPTTGSRNVRPGPEELNRTTEGGA